MQKVSENQKIPSMMYYARSTANKSEEASGDGKAESPKDAKGKSWYDPTCLETSNLLLIIY